MMNSETLVRDIVDAYAHAGLTHDTIKQRDFFLSFLTICFINHVQKGYYSEQVELLFNIVDTDDLKSVLEADFINKSHASLFNEVVNEALALPDLNPLYNMTDKLSFLLESEVLGNFDAHELTVVYDHVLQRLQLMNAEDRLSKNFTYQDPPYDFSELISLLAAQTGAHIAYDPLAFTGESSVSYALYNNGASITTESVSQTHKYIKHKLLIAGVKKINTMHSYALSPYANVEEESFDVAYTLLQPTKTSGVRDHEKLKGFSKEFLDGRVNSKTIFDKYREHGFIQHILWSLKSTGIGFVILGKGPLHRQFELAARKLLIDANYVDAVIQLPSKLKAFISVPLYILVVRKNRASNEKIKFIDASGFCELDGKWNKLTGLNELADMYHSGKAETEILSLVSPADIDQNTCQLTVSAYVASAAQAVEKVDVRSIRSELTHQQKLTDYYLAKLKSKSKQPI